MDALKAWPSLYRLALMGTTRAGETLSLPDDTPEVVRAALRDDREGVLLSLLAMSSLARRAGALMPSLDAEPAASTSICAEESWPTAPEAACVRLRDLVDNGHWTTTPLVHEWLGLAREHQVLVPHNVLPRLLNWGTGALRPLLLPVIGERGRWLAAQNPDWKWAREIPRGAEAEAALRDTDSDIRNEAFAMLRSENPAHARQVLEELWPDAAWEQRKGWIWVLCAAPTPDDEPSLERALDDPVLAVHDPAQQALASLPGSALVQRNTERASQFVSARREKRDLVIEVTEPTWDEAWRRDGIQIGGNYLLRMLSYVPPSFWAQKWGATPEEIVESFQYGERNSGVGWFVPSGMFKAAVRASDIDWLLVFNQHAGGDWENALKKMRAEQREALLIGSARRARDSAENAHHQKRPDQSIRECARNDLRQMRTDGLLRALGTSDPKFWSLDLSRAVLDWMRALAHSVVRYASKTKQRPPSSNFPLHKIEYVNYYALLMAFEALEDADQGWPEDASGFFETERAALRQAYQTRLEMRREFNS